jgi:hypothetical protein
MAACRSIVSHDRNVGEHHHPSGAFTRNRVESSPKAPFSQEARYLHQYQGVKSIGNLAAAFTVMMMTTSCFQIQPVDIDTPKINSPVIVDMDRLNPRASSVVEVNVHPDADFADRNPEFQLQKIFDANGLDEDEIYGRYWVNYNDNPNTLTATDILIHRWTREPDPEEEALCPRGGCWWEASFVISEFEWKRFGVNQCHQVLAVFSDTPWTVCPGSQCTEEPTILAEVVWWVWVYDDPSDVPYVDECGN